MDLQSGVIDGVIAYDLDRLARQPRDLERLIDVFEERPELVFCTITNDIDLSTSDGRTMARVMVAFANKASADTGRRVARKHRELADAGKNGGGFPPFGWKADRITIDPEQAELSGLDIDTRSDIYSLGVLLYELLAGRPPFDPVAMFKILILQAQHNLSDARMEFMIRDRLSWMRFLGFSLGLTDLDAKEPGFGEDTRFAFSFYGGAKVALAERMGLRFQLQWVSTIIESDSEFFCSSTGFCFVAADSQSYDQFELSAGVVFKI